MGTLCPEIAVREGTRAWSLSWGRIKADAVVAARPQRAGIGVTGLVHRTSNPLLRPRRERPRRRAAEQRDELATPHVEHGEFLPDALSEPSTGPRGRQVLGADLNCSESR